MGCGCGNSNKNRNTTGPAAKTTAQATPVTLYELVKDGRVAFRHTDPALVKSRRDAMPGSHYRKAGTTTPL